jgi:hypothetical protein
LPKEDGTNSYADPKSWKKLLDVTNITITQNYTIEKCTTKFPLQKALYEVSLKLNAGPNDRSTPTSSLYIPITNLELLEQVGTHLMESSLLKVVEDDYILMKQRKAKMQEQHQCKDEMKITTIYDLEIHDFFIYLTKHESRQQGSDGFSELARFYARNVYSRYEIESKDVQCEMLSNNYDDFDEYRGDDSSGNFSRSLAHRIGWGAGGQDESSIGIKEVHINHALLRSTVGIEWFNNRLRQFEPLVEDWTFLLGHLKVSVFSRGDPPYITEASELTTPEELPIVVEHKTPKQLVNYNSLNLNISTTFVRSLISAITMHSQPETGMPDYKISNHTGYKLRISPNAGEKKNWVLENGKTREVKEEQISGFLRTGGTVQKDSKNREKKFTIEILQTKNDVGKNANLSDDDSGFGTGIMNLNHESGLGLGDSQGTPKDYSSFVSLSRSSYVGGSEGRDSGSGGDSRRSTAGYRTGGTTLRNKSSAIYSTGTVPEITPFKTLKNLNFRENIDDDRCYILEEFENVQTNEVNLKEISRDVLNSKTRNNELSDPDLKVLLYHNVNDSINRLRKIEFRSRIKIKNCLSQKCWILLTNGLNHRSKFPLELKCKQEIYLPIEWCLGSTNMQATMRTNGWEDKEENKLKFTDFLGEKKDPKKWIDNVFDRENLEYTSIYKKDKELQCSLPQKTNSNGKQDYSSDNVNNEMMFTIEEYRFNAVVKRKP